MFAYRVGFPGWKIAARFGLPLKIGVNVMYDEESKMLVTSSNDFLPYLGIVTEGASFEELQKKIGECCEMAMEEVFSTTDFNQTLISSMTLLAKLP